MSGRVVTLTYSAYARWHVSCFFLCAVVNLSILSFCTVVKCPSSLINNDSSLKAFTSLLISIRCLFLNGPDPSCSSTKKLLDPKLKVSSTCNITGPSSFSLVIFARTQGWALVGVILKTFKLLVRYVKFQCKPDSEIPYTCFKTLTTFPEGSPSSQGACYHILSNGVRDCTYACVKCGV